MPLTREDVIRAIIKRESERSSLLPDEVQAEDPVLYTAAGEQFGSWEVALQYAGVNLTPLLRNQDDAACRAVVREMRQRCRNKVRMTASNVNRRFPRLYRAAIHCYGTWTQALKAAGINAANIQAYPRRNRPSRSRILEQLRERHDAGLSMTWTDACCDNRALAIAASGDFRSWSNALAAAGIPSRPIRRWNRQRVIDVLRSRFEQGLPLNRLWQLDRSVYCAAGKYFGSYQAALQAAGIVNGGGETEQ